MKKRAAALRYNPNKESAPRVLAKGEGKSAQKIIEIAQEHEIPIKEDADLLNMLASVEIDKEIPQEMYRAVAEVFRFIYKTTKK